jgi:molybdopterin-guanine dinucleotide biosynthesis protein A
MQGDDRPRVTQGLILCGGEGRRMGGIDKPLQALAGRPLIEWVLTSLRPQVSGIIISANRNPAAYRRYAEYVVDDGRYSGHGPLAGLLAGLSAAITEDVLLVPGDAPALPSDLLERLATGRGDAAMAHVDDGSGPQPLCCLLRRNLVDDLSTYLDEGGRTPREWYRRHRDVTVDFSDVPRTAWSLNTPQEWAAAEHELRAVKHAASLPF